MAVEIDPYPRGFYFRVFFTGFSVAMDAAFQEVSGIARELKVEEIGCGGENRFKYRVPGVSSFQNLVLKRGIVLASSDLIKWCVKTLDGGLSEPIQTRDVEVHLLNEHGDSCMSWDFIKAYPVKWSTSNLKSQESAIVIESIELAYHYFELSQDRQKEKKAAGG